MDILDDSATASAALEAQADISSEETAVGDADVLDAAGHLTSHNEASMTMEHYAVVDDKVAAWPCPSASVLVLS